MIVLDSSALIEFVLHSQAAGNANHLVDDETIAPALLIPESLNALKKQYLRKRITLERARMAMRRIESAPVDLVSMHDLTRNVWDLAATFSTYDACYVALADKFRVPLVTCDERLAREARKIVTVIVPTDRNSNA